MRKEDAPKVYHRVKNIFFFVGLGVDVVYFLILVFFGLSDFFKSFAAQYSSNFSLINTIYVTVLFLSVYLLHLPLNFFTGFIWEHKFNLSNQNFGQWITDEIKKNAISFVVLVIFVDVIYIFLSKFPNGWWIATGTFWLFINIGAARILPTFIIPLFYKYQTIENQGLRERIKALFTEHKINLDDVYAIDFSSKSKKANAFICGLGKTRRVVLADTLLENFSDEEISTVVAHELGHHVHKDIFKLMTVNTIIIFLSFYMVDQLLPVLGVHVINDIVYFPRVVLGLTVIGLAMTPLLNWFSRVIEVQADKFSIETTKTPRAFITMMEKLGEMNLSETVPSRFNEIFFYDHPPISKRIEFAQNYV